MDSPLQSLLGPKEQQVASPAQRKTKFQAIYEAAFAGDQLNETPEFWDEVLLLKVNIPMIERFVLLSSEDKLLTLRRNLNIIFKHCLRCLQNEHSFRVAHALETLSVLLRGMFRKKYESFNLNVINLVCGADNAESFFSELVECVQGICLGNGEISLKENALNLLTIFVTAMDNINQNALIEYIMTPELFDTLTSICSLAEESVMTFNAVFLLVVLTNYQKYETKNVYQTELKRLRRENTLRAMAKTMERTCKEMTLIYQHVLEEKNYKYSFITSLFWAKPEQKAQESFENQGGMLLGLYELVSNNEEFLRVLFSEKSDKNSTNKNVNTVDPSKIYNVAPTQEEETLVVSNLFPSFFTLTSHLLANVNDYRQQSYGKLALIIYIVLTEKDFINQLFHDDSLLIETTLLKSGRLVTQKERPTMCGVVDVILGFIKHNMKRKFPVELYCLAIDVLQRILSYEKRFRQRLDYPWRELWLTLLRVLKFVSTDALLENPEIVGLCRKIVNIFNIFITFGDTFLPYLSDYDALYYEIMHNCNELQEFQKSIDQLKDTALASDFSNIRKILEHFTRKIKAWSQEHPGEVTTPAKVTEIISDNYNTLKLKLWENLDQFEPFVENPKEAPFFRQLIRNLVFEYKSVLTVKRINLTVN